MPDAASFQRRTGPTWASAYTGGVAVAALLGLAALGRAELGAALMASAVITVVAIWQTSRALRRHRFILLSQGRVAAARPDASPPFAAVFETFPDPAMIIVGGEADDLASRRVAVANAAARDLLRVPREGALLVTALRHPEVLEAVDESLFGGMTGAAAWESGGSQDRVWRAWSTPLPGGGEHEPRALLVIHEETDARSAPAPTSWRTPVTSCVRRWLRWPASSRRCGATQRTTRRPASSSCASWPDRPSGWRGWSTTCCR
jgi:two-component system phosphate regulon sensor histidine kinase PhoR